MKVCLNWLPFQKLNVFDLTQINFLIINLPEQNSEKVQRRGAEADISSVASWYLHCIGITVGVVFAQHLEKHRDLDLSLGKCFPLTCFQKGGTHDHYVKALI